MPADRSDAPHALVDLARYPIADPGSSGARALAARCRAQLDTTGACELPGFVRPEVVARLAQEAQEWVPLGHHHSGKATPYLELPEPGWPDDHPRQSWNPFSLSAIAWDQIPRDSALAGLYGWDGLGEFLADCLGVETLHRYADPLGACSINVMEQGDEVEWHFDMADFVVSIAITDCEEGGDFVYVPLIRSAEDENYEAVRSVLAGTHPGVVQIPMRPGTLLLFEGRRSIHRVTPVEGPTPRLVALLSYDRKPGTCASELLQKSRYGRVLQPDAATGAPRR